MRLSNKPVRKIVTFGLSIVLLMALGSAVQPVLSAPIDFSQINDDGFGDCRNTYAWSAAWFEGKLFVGTNRGSVVEFIKDPDFDCPREDNAAEIWRFTPDTGAWERVYKSPADVPHPRKAGVFLPRESGLRDMIIFEEPDGTEALYVAGTTYRIRGDPRHPRILRSTDGTTFEPVPQDPGTFLGELKTEGFRAMAVYNGRLFITAGSSLGEGVILEAEDPAGGNDNFRQVSPPGLLGFELHVFNDWLYVGSANGKGFSVLKTDANPTSTGDYDFVTVVKNGGYGRLNRSKANSSVLSMGIFQDALYVGSQTDVLRVHANDTWDLVVGNRRHTRDGLRSPISGLGAGFDNPGTGHIWRLEQHGEYLYAGTWDVSVFLRNTPLLGRHVAPEAGFDLWRTKDGVDWERLSNDGLGDKFNHGVRSLVSTPIGLVLGTVNPWTGTEIWLGLDVDDTASPSPCEPEISGDFEEPSCE